MQDTTKIEEYLNSTLNKLTTLDIKIKRNNYDYLELKRAENWETTKSVWIINFTIEIDKPYHNMKIRMYQNTITVEYADYQTIYLSDPDTLKKMQFVIDLVNHQEEIIEHVNSLIDIDLLEKEYQEEQERKRIRREKEQKERMEQMIAEMKKQKEMIRTFESLKGKILYQNWTSWKGKENVIPACKIINVTEKNVMVVENKYHEASSMFTPSNKANKRIPLETAYEYYEKGWWFLKD